MMQTLVPILLGWPSLIGALLLSAGGVRYQKVALVWLALALTLPMSFYLLGATEAQWLGALPIIALLIAAVACHNQWTWLSWGGVAVYGVFVTGLALVVFGVDPK